MTTKGKTTILGMTLPLESWSVSAIAGLVGQTFEIPLGHGDTTYTAKITGAVLAGDNIELTLAVPKKIESDPWFDRTFSQADLLPDEFPDPAAPWMWRK